MALVSMKVYNYNIATNRQEHDPTSSQSRFDTNIVAAPDVKGRERDLKSSFKTKKHEDIRLDV